MISGIGSMNQTMMMRPPQGPPPAPAEVHAELDVDGSGLLDESELQAMIDRMAERQGGEDSPTSAELLSQMDADGDGLLSLQEFEAGRPQGPPPPPRGGAGDSADQAEDSTAQLQQKLLELFNVASDATTVGVLV